MEECTSKTIYDSIAACPGSKNLPGIRRRMYYIPKSDVVTIPALPPLGTTGLKMEELATIADNFVLVEGKFFKFIDLKDNASNVTFESVGEVGTKLFNNQANAVFAGITPEAKGFARQSVNDDLIIIYQNRNGEFCVIGNEAFSTQVDPSGDTAAEPTAGATVTYAISCYDECPVPTYKGKLYLSADTYIDCATGEVMKETH